MKTKLLVLLISLFALAPARGQFSWKDASGSHTLPATTDVMLNSTAATPATTGTMTVSMATTFVTITPTGACTFNATGGTPGQFTTFLITTNGTSSFVLTWGTNFRKTGTLATGTTTARYFSVTFRYDGAVWWEIARTAAQT